MTTRARAIHLKHQNQHLLCKVAAFEIDFQKSDFPALVRMLSSLLRKHYSWPSWPRESLRGYVVHNVRALQKQGKLSQSSGYIWLYVNLSEKQSHRNTIRNHTFVEVWEKNARIATQLRPPCCVAQVKTTCLFTIFLLLFILPLP